MLTRIGRYIEEQLHIFPYMPVEDQQRYRFKTLMRQTASGYTFSSVDSLRKYFSNLMLGGFARVGRDEEGNLLLLADAHEPAIPMDLLGPAYAAITGRYPDGSKHEGKCFIVRNRSVPFETSPALLHGVLASDEGQVTFAMNRQKQRPKYCCHQNLNDGDRVLKGKLGIGRRVALWSVVCEQLDRIVVDRLCAIGQYDAGMAARLETLWQTRRKQQVNEATVLNTQITTAQAQIERLDHLLTSPAQPLTAESERRYLGMVAEAEAELQRLTRKKAKQQNEQDPGQIVPEFYHILGELAVRFPRLEIEQQKLIMRQVIREIKLRQLSPHLFALYIEWQHGIASRPDTALLWRGVLGHDVQEWTTEEDATLRRLYPEGSHEEMLMALPARSWQLMRDRASQLGIARRVFHGRMSVVRYHGTMTFRDLCVADAFGASQDEIERVRETINTLAQQTKRSEMVAHWWLTPAGIAYSAEEHEAPGPNSSGPALSVGQIIRPATPGR